MSKHKIGINRIAGNCKVSMTMSSYNEPFSEQIVSISSGLDDNRYCTMGNITTAYEILRNKILNNDDSNFEEMCNCVCETVWDYFGNIEKIDERFNYFPAEDELPDESKRGKVSDLQNKDAAACIERAMLSHNLLKSLDINSTFKCSYIKVDGQHDGHAYNLIESSGKYYLFDSSIPKEKNGKMNPIIAEIPQEVYEQISNPLYGNGYAIETAFYSPITKMDRHIIYDVYSDKKYNAIETEQKEITK